MKIIYFIAAIACVTPVLGQDPTRFKTQIDKHLSKQFDHDPNKELVVFTGSSSIVRWKTVHSDFPKYNVINYGFGGSHFSDLAYYYDSLVLKPSPDILFIYEGDNDIATGKDPAVVFQQAKSLMEKIRKDLPHTQVVLISPKPCIANWGKRDNYIKLNTKLESYCKDHDKLDFINIWKLMVDEKGIVFQDIFVADGDHMNAKGYKIWISSIGEYLKNCPSSNDNK